MGSQDGNFIVYNGENSGRSEINRNAVYTNNSSGVEQNSRGFHQNHGGVHLESMGTEFHTYSVQQNENIGGYGGHSQGVTQYVGNKTIQQQYGSYGEGLMAARQNTSGFSSERFSDSQGSLDKNYVHNNWYFQQNQNYLSTVDAVMYQQSPSYQQNPNAPQYLQKSDEIHNKMVTSQLSPTPNPEVPESMANNVSLKALDGFCEEGNVEKAVEVLGLLENQGVHVDLPRILGLMRVCGKEKALKEAKAIHEYVLRTLSPLKVSTYNRILEMYSKCDSMNDAFEVFDKMPSRNLTSWDTMITWLAKNGLGEDALDLFMQFKKAGLKPDGQMFLGVFSACGILGDINEGMLHFESMSKDYGIIPSMEHYVSVVEMLGSPGYLNEALEFIEEMPFEPSVDVWETLMNLCRVHGHLELGDRCAELVEQLDPSRLSEQSKVGLIPVKASDLANKEKKKLSSENLLEVKSRVHEYRAGDRSHPESDKIYALLRCLKEQMKEFGYIPETRFVLHDIDQEGKEEALLGHSERLAVVHGLMTTAARSPIRVIKNLRFCGDCHTSMKIISKIVGRQLIMRDAKRFHHFQDGLCSCKDYW
ncbi:hypothetical protein SLEP1_g44223 [Rubroshorea leprosula]|uniref:DYW domain-containing protein n=1 Tax=Rubroshorea leprosula TaxID=152421 RepID=A0AAV5LG38_9ROSI|nr:hypothetical protein SLEP1_g44223 [Rubroshorea leprosula]